MDLAQALIFSVIAAIMFRIQTHVSTKIERALWIIAGLSWTLAATIKYLVIFTRF